MPGRPTTKYSLLFCNPVLAREWHPTKNGSLTPSDVSVGSNRKVWWLCSKGHAWPATVS
ncbi:MAG: zinc-ribbon domain-containing protein, partial [Smithella sp.]